MMFGEDLGAILPQLLRRKPFTSLTAGAVSAS